MVDSDLKTKHDLLHVVEVTTFIIIHV